MDFLGIDVGKHDVHAFLLQGDRSALEECAELVGRPQATADLVEKSQNEKLHVCLEATGGWSEDVALALCDAGYVVSLVNPARIKAYAQSELSRTKTDKADAALIARYCRAMNPRLWEPPSPSQRRLQRLGRRRVALLGMRVQEGNRLQAPGVEEVRSSIEVTIAFLERQIAEIDAEITATIDDDPTLRGKRELLESIPGIGERVATTL